ncbi:orotate phosphoribosyltransferase [Oscillospiraceae bacterium PP1C4]
MITRERVEEVLRESGVLLEGHFLLTSGKHSNKYMQCAKIFRHTKYSEELCSALAEMYKDEKIDVVIGPAMGAVQMAYEVSRSVGCENFFTEREDGKMVLRRGFEITPGMRCLLVEDVVTTGGSVAEVAELVKASGGVVVGIGSIVDRSNGKVDFGVPFKAVYPVEVISWEADQCPLCKDGKLPVVKPGSRKLPVKK